MPLPRPRAIRANRYISPGDRFLQSLRRGAQRRFPLDLLERAVDPHQRLRDPLARVDALEAEAVAVRNPGLVDGLVFPRHDAHDPAAQRMRIEIGAERIVRRHQGLLLHLPGARVIAERFVVERAHGAQIDDVGRQLVIDALFDVGANLHLLAAAGRAHLRIALNLQAEAHAAGAMNAARHVGRDQRPEVLVFDDPFAFGEARDVAAETHREILQLALAALIADRAIERMIDEQKLHGRALGGDGLRRLGEHLHALRHRRRARRHRLRRLLDLDQAHAAVGCDGQFFVVAESRNVDIRRVGDLHDHLALARLQ